MQATKMDTVAIRFIIVLTILNVVLVHSNEPNRRFLNQLRSFRREVREDMYHIETDISTLFDTVKDVKKSGTLPREDSFGNKTIERGEKCASDFREVIDEITQINTIILKALESEKRLNRQLQSRLQALESEVRINRELQNKLQDLESDMQINQNKLKTFEDELSDIAVESLNKLKTFEDAISDMAVGSQNKLNTFEDALSDIAVDMETFMTYVNDTLKKPVRVSLATSYCSEAKASGVFDIYTQSIDRKKTVYCDADTDGGGWIVIMRRMDGSVDFDRKWDDYKNGFGNIEGEFWIGNDLMHTLTQSKSMELRIDMDDYAGNKAYAKYSHFRIGPEAESYILHVGGYSGTAGDSLVNVSSSRIHNGMEFSTREKDNDLSKITHCASYYEGGWWFNACSWSLLTGKYGDNASLKKNGIFWSSWTEWERNMKYVDMKIR